MSNYYLGIDGGGTKTRATILDETGWIVGTGVGESSNIGNIGKEKATAHIHDAVSLAATQAGIAPHSFTSAFLGIAGVVSAEDRKNVVDIAMQLRIASPTMIGVDHDCRIALAGGLAGEPGIVQIIGTGTSCFGIDRHGNRWLAGGWGYLLSDEGGGYWLGIQAIKAAVEHSDGRGDATILTELVQLELQINSMRDIMNRLYTEKLSVSKIAALSRIVIDAARQNDIIAENIIRQGMSEVARCVVAVVNQLDFEENDTNLALVGGMTQAGDIITKPLETAIHNRLPSCKIHQPQFDASVGAALLAREHHTGRIDDLFKENMKSCL